HTRLSPRALSGHPRNRARRPAAIRLAGARRCPPARPAYDSLPGLTGVFRTGGYVLFPRSALHEPAAVPPGFGVRQSSGAFSSGPRAQKRQRTSAVQDASAPAAVSSRFMVPMHAPKRKEALHEPTHPRPLPRGEQTILRGAKVPLLGGVGGGFRCARGGLWSRKTFPAAPERAGKAGRLPYVGVNPIHGSRRESEFGESAPGMCRTG